MPSNAQIYFQRDHAANCYVCRAGQVGDLVEIGRLSYYAATESDVAMAVWRTEMRHKFEEMKMN